MASRTITKRKRMGYATIASLLSILACHKDGKLDFPLTPQKLQTVGVPEWNAFILYHTLEDLAFIHNGYATDVFDRLAQAYETDQTEYRFILRTHLKRIYPEVFDRIHNFALASQKQLYDAFSGYDLPKQHRKMVALFKGLCREADLLTVEDTQPQESDEHATVSQSSLTQDNASLEKSGGDIYMPEPLQKPSLNGYVQQQGYSVIEGILDALEVLRQLPKSPHWTETSRQSWLKAIEVNVNLLQTMLQGKEEK